MKQAINRILMSTFDDCRQQHMDATVIIIKNDPK